MNSQWREKYIYPILGVASVIAIAYLNFTDQLHLPVMVLWQNRMAFVSANSTHFVLLNGSRQGELTPFYVNGWNSYWLLEESVAWGDSRSGVSRMLRRASQMGLTVCRTWAFSDGPGPNSIQISPGVFNEKALKGLDFLIVEARKNNVRLILSLVNNLNAFGGKAQYVKWANEFAANVSSTDDDPFFSDPVIKGYYKAYVKAIVTRRNVLSGVKYSEEPAIFAWELMNEPRCESNSSAPVLQAWITEMSAYIKSLDQKHMVTIGLEGFYGPNSTNKGVNPGDWASSLGTDFLNNSAVADIDFASVHAYPDSWLQNADLNAKVEFMLHWVDSHIRDGENHLKKPVLFTEVGSSTGLKSRGGLHVGDILLETVYDKIYESASKGEAGAGALIWQLLVEGMEEYSDEFSVVPWKHPYTYKIMIEQSCRLRRVSEKSKGSEKLSRKDPCFGVL